MVGMTIHEPTLGRLKRLSSQASVISLVLAGSVLLGWLFGIPSLQSILTNLVGMSLVTAISIVLGALSLMLLQASRTARLKRVGILLAALVLIISLGELLCGPWIPSVIHLSGWRAAPGGVLPTSMSPYTGVALALLAGALALLNWETEEGHEPAQFMALASMAVAFFVLIGYAYGIQSIIKDTPAFPMALNTAIAIMALGLGVLCARPHRGPMVIIASETPGGHLMRRLIPAFLVLPIVFGWLRLQAERAGLFDAWFGVALMTVLMAASFLGLTWWNAFALDRKERERQATEEELRRREAALRDAYEQLKVADRHKDEFLSVISHELKTPLNFVTGFVSFLQDGVGGRLNAEQQSFADRAMAGAERLLQLIDDLVDYARILSGKLSLDVVPTPYEQLLEEALERIRPEAEQKRLTLRVSSHLQGLVCIDGYRMAQALKKLLDNAVKFTPEGGRVELESTFDGSTLKTEVRDTGPGVALQEQGTIFQHFRQVDMTATRESGGMGLGLPIARGIIEAHGGTIGLRSEPGKGSTFWLMVPAACED